MNWTKTPPTKPGAYWWRQKQNQCSFLVELTKLGDFGMAGATHRYTAQMLCEGEWSSRLVPVEEVERAFHEGWFLAKIADDSTESDVYKNSRARRVVEGDAQE